MKKQVTQEIKDFCKEIGITEAQFFGKEEVKGSLLMDEVERIPEGFNPTVGRDLDLSSITSIPEGFNPTVGRDLELSNLTSIPEGFNPTVGRDLELGSLTSIPEGFNPTVGGDLKLNSLTSIPKGFSPAVGGDLGLDGLTSIPEGFNPTVGGSLWLGRLTSIPEGFNPIVGGTLKLNGLTSIPEGFSPIVGGSLYLNGLTCIPEGFSPVVGENLFLHSIKTIPHWFNPSVCYYLYYSEGCKSIDSKIDCSLFPDVLVWDNGKYIKADGIFTEVVSKRGKVYRVRKIGEESIFYLVTDGKGNWSHGSTLVEAREDLIFKISNRSTDEYKTLTLESELTFEEGVEAYRVITGACSLGARDFVRNRLKDRKKKYKVSEIISVTHGEYGNRAFESFFNEK